MESTISWNSWIKHSNEMCEEATLNEIEQIESNYDCPIVEKELKLGYLYHHIDKLARAQKCFLRIIDECNIHKDDSLFFEENKKGLNILYMGFHIQPDGCGGWEIIDTDCCGDGCGPICACIGIAAVMACCGIEASDVCTYQGSGPNDVNTCCGMSECCGQKC